VPEQLLNSTKIVPPSPQLFAVFLAEATVAFSRLQMHFAMLGCHLLLDFSLRARPLRSSLGISLSEGLGLSGTHAGIGLTALRISFERLPIVVHRDGGEWFSLGGILDVRG